MKLITFILLLVVIFCLCTPAYGEETERERLVRIETKLDTLIEASTNQNDRLMIVERRVELHGSWWGFMFAFVGITAPVVVGSIFKAVSAYVRRPIPLKEGS